MYKDKMNNLPKEVFREIFLNLDQKQKVECMTVCKKWDALIKENCLFHTIRITSYKKLSKLILETRTAHLQKPSCQILIMDQCRDRKLPRVSELDLTLPTERSRLSATEYWRVLLQYINVEDSAFMKLLLRRVQFRNIKTLVMTYAIFDFNSILKIITEIPELTHFLVQTWTFSMEGLELLHYKLPLLTKLTIRAYWLNLEPALLEIEPSPLMKSFHLDYIQTMPVMSADNYWLDYYICRKYPNLSDIQYCTKWNVLDKRLLSRNGGDMALTRLESGLCSLFSELGPKLKRLSIKAARLPKNVFQMMDEYNCRLSSLSFRSITAHTMLDSFLVSNQINTIRKLEFSKTTLPLKDLSVLTGLEELSLDFNYPSIRNTTHDIKIILDAFPDSLKTLSLSKLALTSNGSTPRIKSRLVKIRFFNCVFRQDVDTTLARCLPQLKHFNAFFCTFQDMKISLPNIHLASFYTVFDRHLFGGFYYTTALLVRTPSYKCTYSQTMNGDDWNPYPMFGQEPEFSFLLPSRLVPFWKDDGWRTGFTLDCGSVGDVFYSLSGYAVA
ncbi:hypothetical protein K501DRAFT_270875 [Backusella circina FSU 941]|nr:hypothetical protein K501DRAFT_270875 [Backusella circina FSU 941]